MMLSITSKIAILSKLKLSNTGKNVPINIMTLSISVKNVMLGTLMQNITGEM